MTAGIHWWVDLWRRREHPRSLALVRIFVAAVLLVDLIRLRSLGLVPILMGDRSQGGLGVLDGLSETPWLVSLLGRGVALHEGLWWGMTLSAGFLLVGWFPRCAALTLALTSAQFAIVLPAADRGIDMLLRNVLWILVFSQAGDCWSVGVWLRRGWWTAPDHTRIPAWPRYLIALQLVVLYFAAGMSKMASSWTPLGGMSALYFVMSDPHLQRIPEAWTRAAYRWTQVGTLLSWIWEWTAPVLLLAWWYRDTPERGGRLRRWMNQRPVAGLYLLVGVVFHLGTHGVLRLGIFPFAVLALYPAAFHPDGLRDTWRSLSDRWRT